MTGDAQKDMVDKRTEREDVLKLWSTSGKSNEQIATIMGITVKEVHNHIYGKPVSLSAISNEEELVQTMWAQGRTDDEIAGILDIDVKKVSTYLREVRMYD